ncbi:MAG: pyrroline-5-carboxylate reductase family protein [Saccharofermentanales bacterium]|jgi:pyrroline-5-carboxylate reductase
MDNNENVAFIGSGVMGTALATAAARSIKADRIMVTDVEQEKALNLSKALGCLTGTNNEAVERSKYLVFCVKPQFLISTLNEIKKTVQSCLLKGLEKVIVSIVAGIDSQIYFDNLCAAGMHLPIIRMLPNTACLIGKGYTLILDDGRHSPEHRIAIETILKYSGDFYTLPPSRFVAGTVLTSTSPAFVTMFVSSLADGGVYNGLMRSEAKKLALQGILSTVQLMIDIDKHPEQLKDEVCSPGGPAIFGVKSLEDTGFRKSVINAVVTAYARFGDMENFSGVKSTGK